MKRKTLFGLLALFLCISTGDAQGTPNFSSRILVSGDGARVVFEHSPHQETSAPIKIYQASSHRKIGQILAARRWETSPSYGGDTRWEYEGLRVQSVSNNGRHLLIRRGYNLENDASRATLEAWDIDRTPRLRWRKRGGRFFDAKWVGEKIVVLLPREVQRWNAQGKVISRLPLRMGSALTIPADTLSSDGTRAVICTTPPVVIETQTGRVVRKLDLYWTEYPVELLFGPKNRHLWGYIDKGNEFAPSTGGDAVVWNMTTAKTSNNAPQHPIFSPDGSAFWNDGNFRFKSIATGKAASLRAPKPFTNGSAFLQAISNNGRVWAGLNRRGEPFWVTTR